MHFDLAVEALSVVKASTFRNIAGGIPGMQPADQEKRTLKLIYRSV
jgi:hypothetical protein